MEGSLHSWVACAQLDTMTCLPACVQIADGSVMVSSKDGQNVVQLASYDMAIVDNSIVARQVRDSLLQCVGSNHCLLPGQAGFSSCLQNCIAK
jgi:hypothetical protein